MKNLITPDKPLKAKIVTTPLSELTAELLKQNPNSISKKPKTKEPEIKPEVSEPFEFNNPNITKSDYLQIPQTNKVISKYEVAGYNNLNWENTHFKLQENNLYMPTLKLFTTHFLNVLDSYQNNKPLFDSNGNTISRKETKDIALHLLKDHLVVYGNQKGAWTWLDAFFKEENNGMEILSEHIVKKHPNGNKFLAPRKRERLEDSYLKENCYTKLKFNSQGLPTENSSKQEYDLGKNLYFWKPVNERVAGFVADSVRANLGIRTPSSSGSSLGVFAVAQGEL